MTVSTLTNSQSHFGDGVATDFAFTFSCIDAGHIRVFVDDAEVFVGITVVLNSDQSANPGGTVTFSSAPAVAAFIDIFRDTIKDQQTDYNAYDPFPAETHEKALDKLTLIAQDIAFQTSRYVRVPAAANSAGTPGWVSYDSDYLYVCVATNTWKRVLLSTW